jgi:hypothetical protein
MALRLHVEPHGTPPTLLKLVLLVEEVLLTMVLSLLLFTMAGRRR